MEETKEIVQIHIPKECYKYSSGDLQIRQEASENYAISGYNVTTRFAIYVQGAEFPYESIVLPETLWVTNQAKSIFIEALKFSVKKRYILGTIYTLIFDLKYLLHVFNWVSHRILSPKILKDRHLSVFAIYFQYMVFEFLRHFVDEEIADKTSEIVTHMVEHDDAYKQIIKDMFSATDKDKLKNPKEISRLFKLFRERNNFVPWSDKFKGIAILLRIMLIFPKVKRAYIETINNINIEAMSLTDADMYWSVKKNNYKFMGMTLEERIKYCDDKGWQLPNSLI